MVILLTIIHVIVCVFLAVVVLLQSGKAADLAGAFGGMGSQTVFGPRGSATILSKATTIAAAVFMVTSLTLSIMATKNGKSGPSILDKAKKPVAAQKSGATPQSPVTLPQPGQPGQQGRPGPITATPIVGGQAGQPITIPVPAQKSSAPTPVTVPAPAPAQK
jgi:preprotein translocase subunit SecG